MDSCGSGQSRLLKGVDGAIDAVRQGAPAQALLLIGFSRLDFVSCSLGLSFRDAVLSHTVTRIRDFLPGNAVLEPWGDKFGVLARCDGPTEAMNLAQRLVALCSVPHRIEESEIFCPPFIGVRTIGPDCTSAASVLQDALFAMEDARVSHLGTARPFDPARKQQIMRNFMLENDLRAAFETGNQFHVVYQPLVDLSDPETISLLGFEALCRWTHPVLGAISPDEFIPVTEECGLILGLGNYVLWEACRQQVEWAKALGRPVTMSVNLSPVQLNAAGIEDTIAEAMAGTGIEPHCLKLEVTETALAANPAFLAEKLRRIKATGVAIGVDDFGSGYSSLGQLDLFGLDFMKIDKSLIQRLGPGGRQTELVRLTIALAKHLGMFVVAEGIEDQEHLDALRTLGVDIGQGYLFARPLPPRHAAECLSSQYAWK